MLVLKVKPGEEVTIGSAVITVLKTTGSYVRIGVEADKAIPIVHHRPKHTPDELAAQCLY